MFKDRFGLEASCCDSKGDEEKYRECMRRAAKWFRECMRLVDDLNEGCRVSCGLITRPIPWIVNCDEVCDGIGMNNETRRRACMNGYIAMIKRCDSDFLCW